VQDPSRLAQPDTMVLPTDADRGQESRKVRKESWERSGSRELPAAVPTARSQRGAPNPASPFPGRRSFSQSSNETSSSSHGPSQKRSRSSRKQERRGGRRGTPSRCAGARAGRLRGRGAPEGTREPAGRVLTFLFLQRQTPLEKRYQQHQQRGSGRPRGSHRCWGGAASAVPN
jgi:hypothetical protein